MTSLFVVELIFYFISRFIKNNWVLLITVFTLGYFAYSQLQSVSGGNILPWSIDQSLYFLVLFGIGYLVRGWFKKDLKKSPILIILSGLFIWFIWNGTFYQKIWKGIPDSGYVSGVVWALLAIAFIIYISQFLAASPLLNAMGRNSLTLMALHTALSFKLFNIYVREGLVLEDHPNMLDLFLTIFTITTLLPVSYVINKFFPFILGKKYKIKLPIQKKRIATHLKSPV